MKKIPIFYTALAKEGITLAGKCAYKCQPLYRCEHHSGASLTGRELSATTQQHDKKTLHYAQFGRSQTTFPTHRINSKNVSTCRRRKKRLLEVSSVTKWICTNGMRIMLRRRIVKTMSSSCQCPCDDNPSKYFVIIYLSVLFIIKKKCVLCLKNENFHPHYKLKKKKSSLE